MRAQSVSQSLKIESRASYRCKQELVARSNGGVERHRTAQMRAEAEWTVSGYFDSCESTETSGGSHCLSTDGPFAPKVRRNLLRWQHRSTLSIRRAIVCSQATCRALGQAQKLPSCMAEALVTVGACVHKVCLSHSRLSLVRAADASSSWLREERDMSRDTGRRGHEPRLARLAQDISRVTD